MEKVLGGEHGLPLWTNSNQIITGAGSVGISGGSVDIVMDGKGLLNLSKEKGILLACWYYFACVLYWK
jgi:hypothetical protein